MKETKMYLNYLVQEERRKMTNALDFLHSANIENKNELITIAKELYSQDTRLTLLCNNGNIPDEATCRNKYEHKEFFYTLVQFEQKDLTEQMIRELGSNDGDWDWRYFYAISLSEEDRELYIVSYSNACSPNWNHEYNLRMFKKLQDVDFPILKEGCMIYRMDDSLHSAINEKLISKEETFYSTKGFVSIVVKDQHGNYTKIEGVSLDDVFRNYANNYTGYRNYRRQMASEWEIVNDDARKIFEKWKTTAIGLKSDFDKFYGGGIVD